ncbi:MAG: hypothetical protein KCHDKBKB_02685 [Elusimicrobia bacterium]|nr:hypothetical protein [Elusimicrobiota bacterium]
MWSALPAVSLENLIVPGPVERGFYVAVGGRELSSRVLKKLVDLLDGEHTISPTPEVSLTAAEAPDVSPGLPYRGTFPGIQAPEKWQPKGLPLTDGRNRKLVHYPTRYWRRNSRIGQLIWVDSGNVFDPYLLSVEAKKRKLDPVRVLRAIRVGRPFTAFQYQQMLERVPNPALWAPDGGNLTQSERIRGEGLKNSQAVWWTPLVVISDLMGLFYDPDLPDDALIRAFRSFMIRLTFLRQRAIVLALLHEDEIPVNRRHLLPDVLKLARRVSGELSNESLIERSPIKGFVEPASVMAR